MTNEKNPADMVSLDRELGLCNLIIVAHDPWAEAQLLDLEGRINACLQWVESGEIYLAYPAAQSCEFVINLQFVYAPNEETQQFLAEAQNVLDDAGYALFFGPLGNEYASDEVK